MTARPAVGASDADDIAPDISGTQDVWIQGVGSRAVRKNRPVFTPDNG
jgi:hypothetical protein